MGDYKLPIITGTSLNVGDLLRWDGDNWVNYPDSNYGGLSGLLEDLDALGPNAVDGEFLVGTGVGTLAWEKDAIVRTSLGLGTGDSPIFTALVLIDLPTVVPYYIVDLMEYASDELAQAAYVTSVIDFSPNLIAHWKLNDNLSTNVVLDAVGNHNGILTDGVNNYTSDLSTSSKPDSNMVNAFDFDGADDSIKIDDHADLSFGDGASTDSPFSVSFWINKDDGSTYEVLMKGDSDITIEYVLNIASIGFLHLILYDDNKDNWIKLQIDDALISAGSWKHCVVTYDGSGLASGITFYVDGIIISSTTATSNGTYDAMHDEGGDLYISQNKRSAAFGNGQLDNVMLFDKELSQAEVTALYNAGKGVEDLSIGVLAYSEDTIKEQGSYSLKGVVLTTSSLNDTLTRTVDPALDLSGQDNIYFKVRASRTGAQFKVSIHDSGGATTDHPVNIASANVWQTETWDISGVSDANKNDIDEIIITMTNVDAENIIYLDDLYAGIASPVSGQLWNDDGTIKIYIV